MEIKDIIEKLERDLECSKENMVEYSSHATRYFYISDLLDWIKSNLEEGYERYGVSYDDWKESKIAEEREG